MGESLCSLNHRLRQCFELSELMFGYRTSAFIIVPLFYWLNNAQAQKCHARVLGGAFAADADVTRKCPVLLHEF